MPGEISDLNHVARFRQRQEVHAADRPSGLLYHCDRAQWASPRDLSRLTFRQHDNIPKTIQQCRYPGLITFLAKENRCICTLRVRGMRGNSQLLQQRDHRHPTLTPKLINVACLVVVCSTFANFQVLQYQANSLL